MKFKRPENPIIFQLTRAADHKINTLRIVT